ncbi:MAG: 8-amino-7-oxononanoate synthase [Pseudomonadales bacterium]|jgi:8-amino-7-oxononanoate synthase|nr:8-amino-7-oxononanoate synthase [Pseudomonadales bacterium]
MASAFNERLQAQLDARRAARLYRERREVQSPQGTLLRVDGRELLNFCGNDYLGLANDPRVKQACIAGIEAYGTGSGASHLVCGHGAAHEELEQALAKFTGRSRALVYSSGFMANVGVLTALLGPRDAVFEDRLNHASLLDGGLYSGARFKRYAHLDTTVLERLLEQDQSGGERLVVSDGVFSMDGDVAPLAELMNVCERRRALLMIDDAHGFGCLGSDGGGLARQVQEQGTHVDEDRLPILLGTLGKAFGTAGAFVAGSEALIETLIQFSRPYIYSTAPPPALASATLRSLDIVRGEPWRREHLRALITRFRRECLALGFTLTDSATPIQGLLLGGEQAALDASARLQEHGLLVSAIRPPTVPPGTARLRLTFSALHTSAELDRLLDALATLRPSLEEPAHG